MAQNKRQLGVGQLAPGHVQIHPADPACTYLEDQFAFPWLRARQARGPEHAPSLLEQHGMHRFGHGEALIVLKRASYTLHGSLNSTGSH